MNIPYRLIGVSFSATFTLGFFILGRLRMSILSMKELVPPGVFSTNQDMTSLSLKAY